MATNTTNYNFTLPSVNSPTDENLWGGQLNGNFTNLDAFLLTASNITTRATTATDGITSADQNKLILANAASGAYPEDLPAASSVANGFMVIIKKTDSSGNTVTVTPNGADTVEGISSFVLGSQYAFVALVSDHVSNWDIIGQTAPAVNTATSSTLGIVKPDNSTITISGGVISAVKQGLTLGTATTFNSATTYNVTSLPSGIKQLTMNLQGVSVSGNADPLFQIGDASDGLKTTGYLSVGQTFTTGGGNAGNTYTTGIGLDFAANTPTIMSGSITFNLIDIVNNIWVATYVFSSNSNARIWTGGGQVSLAAALDRITFTTVAGTVTWTAGKINISYQ